MLRVVKTFADLQDNKYLYHAGDEFPRNGAKVSAERINELKGTSNKLGVALIEEIVEEKKSAPKKGKKADDTDESL